MKKLTTILFILLLFNINFSSIQFLITVSENASNANIDKVIQVTWSKYHNYSEITTILRILNESYSNIVRLYSIGKTWNNRNIWCIELSNHKVSKPKPALFIVSYHHARERITIEVALHIAWYLVTNYATNDTIKEILEKTVIYIIPALNADGIEASEINPWQRKNLHPIDEDGDGRFDEDPPNDVDGDGKIYWWWNVTHMGFEGYDDDGDGLVNEDWFGGVDLNRNYDFHWNDTTVKSGSSDLHSEVYIGSKPFSEPETQAIKQFVEKHENIKYALSFHSGVAGILYPWSYTSDPSPDEGEFLSLAGNMSEISGYPYLQSGKLYTASGEWGDWMYGVHNILAFTIEVYGQGSNVTWVVEHTKQFNGTMYFYDIWEYFNPPEDEIETVLEKNLKITLFLASKLLLDETVLPYVAIVFPIIFILVVAVLIVIIVKKSSLLSFMANPTYLLHMRGRDHVCNFLF